MSGILIMAIKAGKKSSHLSALYPAEVVLLVYIYIYISIYIYIYRYIDIYI
jgi:hypothetical protein